MSYLGAAIAETMRLMPIAVGVARRLKVEREIGGFLLPAGTALLPAAFLAQRDPAVFADPERFDPHRFFERKVPMTSHFPFGLGVWRCLGASFADYEMRVVLSRMLMRFSLKPLGPARPLLQGITIQPRDGLPMLVERSLAGVDAVRGAGESRAQRREAGLT